MAYKVYMGKMIRLSNPKAKFTRREDKFAKGLKRGVEHFVSMKTKKR